MFPPTSPLESRPTSSNTESSTSSTELSAHRKPGTNAMGCVEENGVEEISGLLFSPRTAIDLSVATRRAGRNLGLPVMDEPSATACGEAVSGALLYRYPPPTHRRLVLDTPILPLDAFSSSWGLVSGLKDALVVHRNVYRDGLLHCDISARNIFLGPSGGVLIDWDLARPLTGMHASMSQRIGPLHFVACRLLETPTLPRELRDDVESFVHVLVWTVCRHAPSNAAVPNRSALIQAYDTGCFVLKSGMAAAVTLGSDLGLCTPQLKIVLRSVTSALYARFFDDAGLEADQAEANKLLTHDWLIARLGEALGDAAWRNLRDAAVPYVHASSEYGFREFI